MTYPGPDAAWLNIVGDFDVLEWIELLATATTPQAYGARIAWFLWDLAGSTTCRQLTTGTYPGQGKRPPTQHQRCSCHYGMPYRTTHEWGHMRFTINVMCVHHGSNLVRQCYRLGLRIERWQVEVYEASIRNGIPIQFTTNRGRRW